MIRSETTAPLPATSETVAEMPSRSTTTSALPRRSETTLPAGMIPKFPPRTWAAFTGEGALATVAGAGGRAQFSGNGSLAVTAVAHAFTTAAFSGSGSLAANVLNQSALAQFSGSGALTALGRPTAAAGFAGTGALSAKANPVAKAQFSGTGSLTATTRASAAAAFNGSGSLSAVAVTAAAMGMDKNGTQSISGGTWTQITNWVVRSGFPDTVISSHALALRTGTYSTIEFKATIENSRQMALRIMKNGTTQLASSDSGGNVLTWTVTATNVTIVNGDLITVEANPTAGRIIQSGASNTYVIATPA